MKLHICDVSNSPLPRVSFAVLPGLAAAVLLPFPTPAQGPDKAGDLKAFAGRCERDELKAVIQMATCKGGSISGIYDSPGYGFEFKPVDRDTFQPGMLSIRFRGEKAGNVGGLDFSNPVLRKVAFTRLSDGTSSR